VAMTRHGELMSTPGDTSKVPALDFRWLQADGATETTVLTESRYGEAKLDGTSVGYLNGSNTNYVCDFCHASDPDAQYYRVPEGVSGIQIINVWTTDLYDVVKTSFSPNEDIRYHVSFEVTGSGTFFVKSPKNVSKAFNTSGSSWETLLGRKKEDMTARNYEWRWNKKIPTGATDPSSAKVKIQLKLFDVKGGTLLDKHTRSKTFSID
jgi:hypothetical protein